MIEKIKSNINNPEILEMLFRENQKVFESDFETALPEIKDTEMAKFWKARLDFGKTTERMKLPAIQEISSTIIVCLITVFLIKLPDLLHIDLSASLFYEKNLAIVVFFGLTLFTLWINKIENQRRLLLTAVAFLIPLVYINLLPVGKSASVNLAYIHLPLLMWCIFGIVFTGFDFKSRSKRIDFIRFNGDLVVIYAIIAIAGGILTVITVGLFHAIGINIQKFYTNNIVVAGAVAAPVVGVFIIRNFTTLTNRIAPLIAAIFSPLVLVTLVVYLVAMAISGKDPYNDRDFLMIFNIMLIGVMGIIVFSVSETSVAKNQKFNQLVLFLLSIVTIVIDLIAVSAIFYRLGEFGVTPNRLAILVSNILILVNLILIMIDLFRINFRKGNFEIVEISVAKFIPVYLAWIMIVIFLFPLLFGMK